MINEGILEKFQISLEKYLSGLNDFRSITILNHKQSDLNSIVKNSLSEGLGISIAILPPKPVEIIPNAPGPVFKMITCEIKVIENLAMNETSYSAMYIAEKLMEHLHLWHPQINDWNEKLMLAENTPWDLSKDGHLNIISMHFETHCSLKG